MFAENLIKINSFQNNVIENQNEKKNNDETASLNCANLRSRLVNTKRESLTETS